MPEARLKAEPSRRWAVTAATPARKIRGLRWWIVGLVFLATLINYIDRLTISVLAPIIRSDLGLSNLEYASISTWFLLAYSISQSLFGKLYDRVGTRAGFAIAISIWSTAAMAHTGARGLFSLSAFRVVLGLGEAGNWPGAAKAVAEWFPIRQRAFGMGIINCGAALGSAFAPPLIIALQQYFGWPMTFLVTGALGFVWLALWLTLYHPPNRHRRITEEERALIHDGQQAAGDESHGDKPLKEDAAAGSAAEPDASRLLGPASPRWRDLLRHREVWAIILARFLADPVWWLYLIWLPLYLYSARGFSLKEIGLFAWAPYLAADAGSLAGGWTSGYLIGRGWTVHRARQAAILLATLLTPAGMLAAVVESPVHALGLISLVLFGFQFWVNNVQTLPSDFFPNRAVASVSGLAGTGAGLGAMIFTLSTGWIVDHFSYKPVLIASGLLVPLATTVLFLLAGTVRRVSLDR